MADDVSVNTNTAATGATNVSVAADVIAGVAYQRVKVALGADGLAADLAPGSAAAAASVPVTASTEDVARVGSLTETAPASDTASSGINGRLQRVAQRLTSLIAAIPTALGSTTASASLSVTASTEDVARIGIITETAPASDTASSGLNGRLQRLAQRLTSLIALVPASLGSKAAASSFAVTASTEDVALQGALTETAPASDTASSGHNGRLQRIAQRITSLIALIPTSLATGGGLRVTVQDTAGTSLDYTIPALVGGDIAHDSPISTQKPVVIGGRAATANPTAVADADVSRIMVDKLGKVVAVGALRDLKAMQSTTITASTSETTIVTAIASTFNDLYGLILSNSSATATSVTIKDSTAGTTRAVIYVPAGDTRGFMLGAGDALPQATVNTAWTATSSASVSSLFVSALYVKNI